MILEILTVISLFMFVISSFIYYLLNDKYPDNSKLGKLIKKNKKHLKLFNNISIITLLITIILLLIVLNTK